MTPTEKAALIRRVVELIGVEERYCANGWARDANGFPILIESPEAVRWCPEGAAIKLGGDQTFSELDALFGVCMPAYVRTHTHPEVIAYLERRAGGLERKAAL